MDIDKISVKMAKQLDLVVDRAREIFVDLLVDSTREGKTGIGAISDPDQRYMERLFSEVVKGHIVAEAAAIVSFLIYIELQDESILNRIVPALMDKCDGDPEQISEYRTKKTGGLAELSRGILDSEVEKTEVISWLLKDVVSSEKTRPMRAAFDAVLLTLLGE